VEVCQGGLLPFPSVAHGYSGGVVEWWNGFSDAFLTNKKFLKSFYVKAWIFTNKCGQFSYLNCVLTY